MDGKKFGVAVAGMLMIFAVAAAEFRSERFPYRIVLPDAWHLVTTELADRLEPVGTPEQIEAVRANYRDIAADPATDYFLIGLDVPYADNLNVVVLEDADFPDEIYRNDLTEVFQKVYSQVYGSPAEISGLEFRTVGGCRALTFVAVYAKLELKQRQYMIEIASRRTLCFTLTTRPAAFEAADALFTEAIASFALRK